VTRKELYVGRCVWAAMGGFGWRLATVRSIGPRIAIVDFETGGKGKGKRTFDKLRPRDPALLGTDKPMEKPV